MKKKHFIKMISLVAFVFGAFVVLPSGCSKDGETGPAGPAGTDGTDANAISAADQAAYDAADPNVGGLFYNKFWVNPVDGSTPATADTAVTNHADFFRCKSCHGWDLLGANGQYISRGPTATRPNVSFDNLNAFASSKNIREIFDAVKHTGGRAKPIDATTSLNSNMPDYGLHMTDGQIWDIVKYLKEARINSDHFYDLQTTGTYPTGTYVIKNLGKNGNATNGAAYYASNCASCHGATGLDNIPSPTETIGWLARNKTAEMNHLVKFGLPGENMFGGSFVHNITATEMLDLNKALADTINFPN